MILPERRFAASSLNVGRVLKNYFELMKGTTNLWWD